MTFSQSQTSKFASTDIQLTYDDVLLRPSESLSSRQDADVSVTIGNRLILAHPIIPANMDTVVGCIDGHCELCEQQMQSGGIAVMHRFMPFEDRVKISDSALYFVSIGASSSEVAKAAAHAKEHGGNFCIDIAHGHSRSVARAIAQIKEANRESLVMAGNVATSDGYYSLVKAGADIVKVGIGPGSHCTTRIVTGCGVPQLSAILEIAEAKEHVRDTLGLEAPIIADGGIRNSGDMVKALAAGADLIMTGSLFAGCPETPGEIAMIDGRRCKQYRGMASREAQIGWFGRDVVTPEGETSFVDIKPPFMTVLNQLVGGIKSGMSYLGCDNIEALQERAQFIRVSPSSVVENNPHGIQ